MKIQGSKIILRTIGIADADSIAKHITADIVRYMIDIPNPYYKKDALSFIKETQAKMRKKEVLRLGIQEANSKEIIGMMGLESIDQRSNNAEIGYWLGKSHWGKGLMTEAVMLMTAYGFNKLKMKRLYARVYGPNIGSAKVLQKVGYKKEGQLRKHVKLGGRYVDEIRYGILSADKKKY